MSASTSSAQTISDTRAEAAPAPSSVTGPSGAVPPRGVAPYRQRAIQQCLFNLLLILGASAALRPLPIESAMLWVEIPLMTAFALAIYPLVRGDLTLGRRQGLVLLAAFVAFMGYELRGL